MAQELKVCDIDPPIVDMFKKFRLRKEKNNAAIILKIDVEKLRVVLDEEYEDVSIEEVQVELPEHLPRYVILRYVFHHDDGRVSYPIVFVFISPQESKPELKMLYAGSKNEVVNTLQCTKIFELRSTEELTEEWLIEKLKFFR